MKRVIFILLLFSFAAFAQKKAPLTHSDYNQWQKIEGQHISRLGKVISYTVKVQEGDGSVEIFNTATSNKKVIERGNKSVISYDEKFVAALVKPPFQLIRSEKKDKKKDLKLSQDSLKVWDVLKEKIIIKEERVKEFKLPKESGKYIAFRKIPAKKNKLKTFDIEVINLTNSKSKELKHISEYTFDKKGEFLFVIKQGVDSIVKTGVYTLRLKDFKSTVIDTASAQYKQLTVFNSKKFAYLSSNDSLKAENIRYSLVVNDKSKQILIDSLNNGIKKGWTISGYQNPNFSENGLRLFFGLQKTRPIIKKDTTLLDEEKAEVDVWSWKDAQIQPLQKANKKKIKEKSYLTVYNINSDKVIQLADEYMSTVILDKEKNLTSVIGLGDKKYQHERSYSYPWKKDLYAVDIETGNRLLVFDGLSDKVKLSPKGTFATFFNRQDSAWYNVNLQDSKLIKLTKNSKKSKFYNEDNDIPSPAGSYGSAYWDANEQYLLLNDRYDIWKVSPRGKNKSVNITNKYGYKNKIQLRYVETNSKDEYILPNRTVVVKGFNEKTKDQSIYYADISKRKAPKKFEKPVMVSRYYRAEDKNAFIYVMESFNDSPNIYFTGEGSNSPIKVSNTNPQQSNYKWGNVDLISWKSYTGKKLDGLMYYPEDFDSTKKYPVIIYFYEIYSERKNKYYAPSPSRSIVNFTYLTSNDYLVFVPDIKYNVGQPGQDSYDAVMAGVDEIEKYSYVDSDNMAIQGQSWGGYQVAYLVTRTNRFKCAMAGAPVSNMTSAYGGIRWKSGMSREFQYERTQSRLGNTLWEEMDRYIDNSPLFQAPKVETPLLMMHNDNDGAVPYYQGIEYFMALRRLGKPAWLLVYNKESHNLKNRKNMKDLTIRMYQFFDYYLKGEKAPKWLIEGVPYIDKGKDYGYELVD
ncbi:MAG: S9 family peptidase [Flavobacteriales bacterium]|nr:S9 family peptidase [Flavobacteriales bacterium]